MSKIEWTGKTWNPIAGCTKVSDGCKNCYAEKMAKRLAAMGQKKYQGLTDERGLWTGKIMLDYKALQEPLMRKKPTTYFVNSMSDLFHENVTDELIDHIFAVMALCPQHTFQVLTKRPNRMQSYILYGDDEHGDYFERLSNAAVWLTSNPFETHVDNVDWPLPNVWLGVSVENQQAADERISLLLETPAAIRFLSCEPLLGPLNLTPFSAHSLVPNALPLDWVIAGGESGPGARPMHPDWVRSLRDQCVAAGVPFFFKQWGEWQNGSEQRKPDSNRLMLLDGDYFPPIDDLVIAKTHDLGGAHEWNAQAPKMIARVGKKKAGRMLDERTWDEMPGEGV